MQALHLESGIQIAPNWSYIEKTTSQWRHNCLTWRHRQLFLDVVLFLLSNLVTFSSFMSISSLVLELWQFSFIWDWPKIQKSEIPPSEFCLISRDWGELGIPNLARMSLNKILLNAAKRQGYISYRFWVIKGKPIGGKITHKHTHTHTQIRVKGNWIWAMTRDHANNILLTINLLFDSDVRQWSYPLMIPLHCLWAKLNSRMRGQFECDVNLLLFCFCFD